MVHVSVMLSFGQYGFMECYLFCFITLRESCMW